MPFYYTYIVWCIIHNSYNLNKQPVSSAMQKTHTNEPRSQIYFWVFFVFSTLEKI